MNAPIRMTEKLCPSPNFCRTCLTNATTTSLCFLIPCPYRRLTVQNKIRATDFVAIPALKRYNAGMKFRYKFSKPITALIYISIALCFVGVGINIFLIITSDVKSAANPVYPIIQYTLMFLIPAVLLIILVSLLISSYYSIEDKYFKTSFGIIKSKYEISDIETVILDRTTNKLSVYFKNNSFIVVVVKDEWYNEFIDALCKANRNISFSIKSKENSGDKDDKK